MPPGLGEAEARARMEEVLGPDGYRLEFDESVVGNRSPIDSPLMDAIRDWLGEQDPEGEVVPMMLPGSPTRAGFATPSPTASPTASSPTSTWRCTRPRR